MTGPFEIVSSFFEALGNREGDPIQKQYRFDAQELRQDFPSDGLDEISATCSSRLIHRYPHHALLIATGRCATRCRFCFRRRFWSNPEAMRDMTSEELESALVYLKQHPEVNEILITGGDPLMLPVENLNAILSDLSALPSIQRLRMGTRRPITDPLGIPSVVVPLLGRYGCAMMLHINHPAELTPEMLAVCAQMRAQGCELFSQTVLLRGINDEPSVLINLCHQLSQNHIKPHYLFHVDPVQGVSHFATGLRRAHAIARAMRLELSSLAMPTLCLDLPHGKGKVYISPDYPLPDELVFESPLTGERVAYPFTM